MQENAKFVVSEVNTGKHQNFYYNIHLNGYAEFSVFNHP